MLPSFPTAKSAGCISPCKTKHTHCPARTICTGQCRLKEYDNVKIAFRHVPFTPEQIYVLKRIASEAGHETIWCPDRVLPELSAIEDCEVLMGYFPPDMLKSLPRLKWIQTPSAGVEKLCGDLYANDDVVLTNCSGAFGVAISEYMITGVLMLMRLMPAYLANQRAHIWKCMGNCRSIYGSTVTVVGMGDIGTKFATRMKALGATVRGVRRSASPCPDCFDAVYTSDRICEAVAGADVVAMCVPGTREAQKLVSAECIAAMRPDAILVNCGRGATLDEEALICALQEKCLGGAVLDVAAVEPLPAQSPLWDMENVIITPHISGHDDDPVNYTSIFEIFRDNLTRYLNHEPLRHVVDRSRGY